MSLRPAAGRIARRFLCVFFVGGAAVEAPAQGHALAGVRLRMENDYFDFWLPSENRPDDNYTHGAASALLLNRVPHWARGGRPVCSGNHPEAWATASCVQSVVTISQQIFNPTIDSPTPVVGERPYAGVLYADFARRTVDTHHAHTLGLRLGTTGHASLADKVQNYFHQLVDLRHPEGWAYQVAEEPVVGLTYEQRYLVTPYQPTRRSPVTVFVTGGAIATNIQSGLNAAVEVRAGYNVPHPWLSSSDSNRRKLSAYLLIGGNDQWVARDLLIQGNSPATVGLVSKRAFVFRSAWGFAIGARDVFLEYRVVSQNRDYSTAPSWHRWGAITLVYGQP